MNTARLIIIALNAALIAACAAPMGERAPVEDASPTPSAGSSPAQPVNSAAVLSLSDDARSAMREGRLDNAAQLLERAIRIEPHNGVLWHDLAQIRYQQGNYDQAIQLASRSNAVASTPPALKRANDELIENSRKALSY